MEQSDDPNSARTPTLTKQTHGLWMYGYLHIHAASMLLELEPQLWLRWHTSCWASISLSTGALAWSTLTCTAHGLAPDGRAMAPRANPTYYFLQEVLSQAAPNFTWATANITDSRTMFRADIGFDVVVSLWPLLKSFMGSMIFGLPSNAKAFNQHPPLYMYFWALWSLMDGIWGIFKGSCGCWKIQASKCVDRNKKHLPQRA